MQREEADPTPLSPALETPVFDRDGALARAFLLRRGHCCRSGCRNCPYGFRKEPAPAHER